MQTHSLLFRLFANCFFSVLIGMSWAFLSSYMLKQSSYRGINIISSPEGLSSGSLAMDNFDILMMVLSPIVSYLMAETFSISGMLALMVCAFLQSMYAQQNLELERSNLLANTWKALSYSFRSICDILIGLSFPLHFHLYRQIGPLLLTFTILMIFGVSAVISYFSLKRMQKSGLVKTDTEAFILFCQNNTRGLLGFTLALQNFNARISAISLLYIVLTIIIVEPVINFMVAKHLKGSDNHNELNLSPQIEDQ